MAQPKNRTNTAYVVKGDDFTGSAYRAGVILQSINGRLSALESSQSTASGSGGKTTITGGNTGYVADAIVTNHVTIDLGLAFTHEVTLNQPAQVTIDAPIFTGGGIAPGQALRVVIVQDSNGGRPAPVWDAAFAGVTVANQIDPTPASYSIFDYQVRLDGLFALVNFITGLPR